MSKTAKVPLETVIDEFGRTLVSVSNKVVEHNQVLAQALEDIISLAELCKGLRERVEALEVSVKSMRPLLADLVVAWDPEAAKKLTQKVIDMHNELGTMRRDMMNRTDPRNFEIDPRSI